MRSVDIRFELAHISNADLTPRYQRVLDGRIHALIERHLVEYDWRGIATADLDVDQYWEGYADKNTVPRYTSDYTVSIQFLDKKGYDWIMASINGQVGGTPVAQVGEVRDCYSQTPLLSLWLAYFRLELGDERPKEEQEQDHDSVKLI